MMRVINVDSVNVVKNGHVVLNNVSLNIEMGTFVSIVGNNGSGKTSLIRVLTGLDKYNGYININGYYLDDVGINDIRKVINVVFDDLDSVILGNTVWDNLVVNLVHLGKSDSYIKKRVEEICVLFDIDRNILDKKMVLLDNSLKQRIMLASAVISKPSILLLDNCMYKFSVKDRKKIMNILNKLRKEESMTILMVTHNMEDVLMTDRVIVMDKGSIVMDGTVKGIFKDKKKVEKYGVSVPFVVELSMEFIKKNKLDNIYLDKGKLVELLWK